MDSDRPPLTAVQKGRGSGSGSGHAQRPAKAWLELFAASKTQQANIKALKDLIPSCCQPTHVIGVACNESFFFGAPWAVSHFQTSVADDLRLRDRSLVPQRSETMSRLRKRPMNPVNMGPWHLSRSF